MAWRKVTISTFLTERKGRYKPDEAMRMKLKRIDKIDFSNNIHLSDTTETKTDMILVKQGDLVISGINAEKGAIAIYRGEGDIMATIHYSSYTYNEDEIDIEYLKWFLKSETFLNVLKEQTKGGIKTELKAKRLLPLEIYLPDKPTQKQILKKLNNIEQEVLELEENIDDTAELLKKLRQSILQDAVKGKLVPQNPKDEPASELLKRIKAEKEKLIKQGKIKKEKPLPPIAESEIPYELPKGWTWCRLGEIASIVRGGSPRPAGDPKYYNGNIPFLKVGDLTANQEIYLSTHTFTIKKEGLYKTRFVEANTLMLTNSGGTLGIPKICTFPTTFNDGIAAFLELSNELDKEYLYYFLKLHTSWFLKEASKGIGQPNLNTEIIGETLLPLPPSKEQKRISEKVKELIQVCKELDKEIAHSKQEADYLLNAILRETFQQKPKGYSQNGIPVSMAAER